MGREEGGREGGLKEGCKFGPLPMVACDRDSGAHWWNPEQEK